MPVCPAIGAATVESPGTNLANSSVSGPRREKYPSVLATQVVASIDILHSNRITRLPNRRPSANHVESEIRHAASTASTAEDALTRWVALNVPAANSSGMLGTGSPSCSTSTHTNRIA